MQWDDIRALTYVVCVVERRKVNRAATGRIVCSRTMEETATTNTAKNKIQKPKKRNTKTKTESRKNIKHTLIVERSIKGIFVKFRKANKDRQTREQTATDSKRYTLHATRYKDTFLARALNKYTKVSQYLGSPGQSQTQTAPTRAALSLELERVSVGIK